MSHRDWSLGDAAENIARFLTDDADYISFRSVCSDWRYAAPIHPQAPLLLVEDLDATKSLQICRFHDGRVEPVELPNELVFDVVLGGKMVCGSCLGWVALADDEIITLHNPFTGSYIDLPPLTSMPAVPDDFWTPFLRCSKITGRPQPVTFSQPGTKPPSFDKIVLSSDPLDPGCVAMALCIDWRRIIRCRPGQDESWTPYTQFDDRMRFLDLIFFKGQFVAVTLSHLFCFNIKPNDFSVKQMVLHYPHNLDPDGIRLAVSSKELLLATFTTTYHKTTPGNLRPDDRSTRFWDVFLVGMDNEHLTLTKLENFRGRELFFCDECTSVSAVTSMGAQGNCIYTSRMVEVNLFREIYIGRVSVFNVVEGTDNVLLERKFHRAHWITPRLCYRMGFKISENIEKNILSLHSSEKYDDMMLAYEELLSDMSAYKTWNVSCSLNTIIDLVFKSASMDIDQLLNLSRFTLTFLKVANNERVWFYMGFRLAKIWLKRGEHGQVNEILEELRKSCQTEVGTDDVEKYTRLLEVFEFDLQMSTEMDAVKQVYNKTFSIQSAIPSSHTTGIICECDGKILMAEGSWTGAVTEFIKAFKNYNEAGNRRCILCLKYIVIINMLLESEQDPFGRQEAKLYKDEILLMTTFIAAHQPMDILEFESILEGTKKTAMDDPFIHEYMKELWKTQILIKLTKASERIKICFISKKLNVSENGVVQLLNSLIEVNRIHGHIDKDNMLFVRSEMKELYTAMDDESGHKVD